MKLKLVVFIIFLSFSWINSQKKETIIPFNLSSYNNIIFKMVLNGTDTLNLKFDTGTTGLLLTHKAIKEKTDLLTSEEKTTLNYVKLKSSVSIKLGKLTWNNLEVYPVTLSGQGTDGRFGWDLFKGKIVVLDYKKREMIVTQELPNVSRFTSTKLIKTKTVLCIQGKLQIENKAYDGPFLIDTGYQKALLLDSFLLKAQNFPNNLKIIKVNELRNGAGDLFITKVIELPYLLFGEQIIKEFPAQLLNTTNPAGFETHILGNEILKRFNTIFDFKNMVIYFQKNGLYNITYDDALNNYNKNQP